MADIIDFNQHKQRQEAPRQDEEEAFPQEIFDHLSSLPDNAMMGSLSRVINEHMVRLLLLTEIGAKVTEVLDSIQLDPNDFAVDPDSADRFLTADIAGAEKPLWNGPWFDWEDGERTIRVATTVCPEDGEEGIPGGFMIDVLRLDEGADHWMHLGEKGWIDDGPPAEYFDLIDMFQDEDWDDDEDDTPIECLDLRPSLLDALTLAGVETIGELSGMSDKELLAIDGIGKKSLQYIREALEEWED